MVVSCWDWSCHCWRIRSAAKSANHSATLCAAIKKCVISPFFPLGCLGNVDRKRGFSLGAQRSVEHAPSDAWWSYSCFHHLTNFSIYFREQTDGYHRQGEHISSCLILLARFCQCLLAFGFNFRFHFSVKIDGKIKPSGFFRICLKILYP